MAVVSSAFNFQWSRWNLLAGRDRMVYQMRQRLHGSASPVISHFLWSLFAKPQAIKISWFCFYAGKLQHGSYHAYKIYTNRLHRSEPKLHRRSSNGVWSEKWFVNHINTQFDYLSICSTFFNNKFLLPSVLCWFGQPCKRDCYRCWDKNHKSIQSTLRRNC